MFKIFCRAAILMVIYLCLMLKCVRATTANILFEYPYQSVARLKSIRTRSVDNLTTQHRRDQFDRQFCTGLIVNSVYILTHARCSEEKDYHRGPTITGVSFATSEIDNKHIMATEDGRVDNSSMTTSTTATRTTQQPKARWIRPDSYGQHPDVYDLALVELEEFISFTHFVHPAVLYFGSMIVVKKEMNCAVLGWNDSFSDEKTFLYFSLLTKVDVEILSDDSCKETFAKSDSAIICVTPIESLDLCKIDLGSPLACGVKNIWIFVGIYTGANTCFSSSNFSENVFVFRKFDEMQDWISTAANGAYIMDGFNLTTNQRKMDSPSCGNCNTFKSFLIGFIIVFIVMNV